MVPAHKQDLSSERPSTYDQSVTQMGFGKVLTSIQGLQQRLQDFSVEDVARTEACAHSLAAKLSELHAELNGLDALKRFVALANARIDQIPEENFDQVEASRLEKYSGLAAILQADALIHRHGLTRPKKSSVITSELKPDDFTATALVDEFLDKSFLAEADTDRAGATTSSHGHIEAEAWVLSTDCEKDFIVTAQSNDFELGSLPGGESPQGVAQPAMAAPIEKTADQTRQATGSPAKEASGFDDRLLNELIESYGEFTVSTGAAPKPEPTVAEPPVVERETRSSSAEPVIAQVKPVEMPASPEPAPIETAPSPKPAPIETAALKTMTRPQPPAPVETLPAVVGEPEEVESKALIVPEAPKSKKDQREARAKERRLQAATKRGEIDRQLKSIIKDYGEYDLYSPRSTINFKLASIGAFVVLGLVLGGLYFFRLSSTPKPAVVSTIEQTDGTKSATTVGTPQPNKPINSAK